MKIIKFRTRISFNQLGNVDDIDIIPRKRKNSFLFYLFSEKIKELTFFSCRQHFFILDLLVILKSTSQKIDDFLLANKLLELIDHFNPSTRNKSTGIKKNKLYFFVVRISKIICFIVRIVFRKKRPQEKLGIDEVFVATKIDK